MRPPHRGQIPAKRSRLRRPICARRCSWPPPLQRPCQGLWALAVRLPCVKSTSTPEVPPMNQLQLFLPCAAGIEGFLADEVHGITGLRATTCWWGAVACCCAGSRTGAAAEPTTAAAQRVLVQLAHRMYRSENDLTPCASGVAWEIWFTHAPDFQDRSHSPAQPAQEPEFRCPQVKDAVADRFRAKTGRAPGCEHPVARRAHSPAPDHRGSHGVHRHLGRAAVQARLARGQGRWPLKETLAAAMIAASGSCTARPPSPCTTPAAAAAPSCVVEAAQIASAFAAQGMLPPLCV